MDKLYVNLRSEPHATYQIEQVRDQDLINVDTLIVSQTSNVFLQNSKL